MFCDGESDVGAVMKVLVDKFEPGLGDGSLGVRLLGAGPPGESVRVCVALM